MVGNNDKLQMEKAADIVAKSKKPKLWDEVSGIEKPGFYPGIPSAEYHSERFVHLISSHQTIEAAKSPAHYKAYLAAALREDRTLNSGTPAMRFGSAAHDIILEYGNNIAIHDFKSTNTNQYRDWEAENKDKLCVSQSDHDKIQAMKKVIEKHSIAKNLVRLGETELSAFADDEMFKGVKLKSRFDYLLRDMNFVIDYKTAASANPDKFTRACIDYGYDVQAAFYLRILKLLTKEWWRFVFIVQEKDPPYAVNCFLATAPTPDERDLPNRQADTFIELGEKKINAGLTNYWNCTFNKKSWNTAYQESMLELNAPPWAWK